MSTIHIDTNALNSLLEANLETFELFESLLAEENKKYNLTRISSSAQVRTRHFLDSVAALPILDIIVESHKKPLRILDAGSGAGFPGLVLAVVRPEWSFVSLEATEKKVFFQKKICDALKLKNVQVIHGRAEQFASQKAFRETFDIVTARALADMSVLAELTLGFLRKNGMALFWKGPSVEDELTRADKAIRKMGASTDQIVPYTLVSEDNQPVDFSLIICRKVRSTPDHFPRAFGLIKKHPLGNSAKKQDQSIP